MINNKSKYQEFEEKLSQNTTEVARYAATKDFMLSLSFDELIEWHQESKADWRAVNEKIRAKGGLKPEDRTAFLKEFEAFDVLAIGVRPKVRRKNAVKAA
ncbi:MAG: hypothetical protein HC817_09665 [Saprospiraceae bacterium]|nr:hypothetical protein [Saprospiraceae bacterium]